MFDLYAIENEVYQAGYRTIAGCDEVGRGPMAGPLVACAVILSKDITIEGLNDSKKLSQKKREALYLEILEKAIEVQVTFIGVDEVDKLNVYQASKKAMTDSVLKMKTKVEYVLTDAMKLNINIPFRDIIKGDMKSASIAAASIVAKVTRDKYMEELDKEFPVYGFKNHKGYVTKAHKEAIEKYGICKYHRKSFKPVMDIINR